MSVAANPEDVLSAALALPQAERAALAARLIASLDDDPALAAEVARLTPSHEELLELARRCPPPQSWYDENIDPFQPDGR